MDNFKKLRERERRVEARAPEHEVARTAQRLGISLAEARKRHLRASWKRFNDPERAAALARARCGD